MKSVTARIVLSFLVLSSAADVLLVWGAALQARRAVEQRALAQTREITGLLTRGGFSSSSDMLGRVKAVIDADVVEVLAGRVRSSTLPRAESEDVARAAHPDRPFAEQGRFLVVAVREGDTTLVFAYDAARLEREKSDAARPLWLFAVAAFLGVVVLGVWLGRTLLRPVRSLVAGAGRVAAGDLTQEVPVTGSDEFGVLAASFNGMLAALRRQREDERWAAAGRVAAGVAHDLRNPLTGILMMVQMLEREEGNEKRREILGRVLTEVKRLEKSVGELMALAAPEPPKKDRVDLGAVVREALELFRGQAEHRGVALEFRDEAPPVFTGDASRARRILDNLVANALDATPAKGRVVVAAGGRDGRVELRVEDTGGGIPESVRGRVFEAFASDKAGGTGLGLATVKRLVDEMGGEIGFETGAGGTVFTVRFPAAAR